MREEIGAIAPLAMARWRDARGTRSRYERSPRETAEVTETGREQTHDDWFGIVRLWVETFDEIAPRTIEGLYVIGSVALDDWQPRSSDIDVVAITAEPADEDMAGALLTAHAVFAERSPARTVDGPFLAWGDLLASPQGVTRPWTLDGSFHHDAECFELNPVTWYTLANYGVRVRGPELAELAIPVDVDDMVRFVIDNALSYWTVVHDQFVAALGELRPSDTLSSSVPVWCLLGACRMLYTALTGDVASKTAAGRWVGDLMGDAHGNTCEAVVALRAESDHDVGIELLRAACATMADVLKRIAKLPR